MIEGHKIKLLINVDNCVNRNLFSELRNDEPETSQLFPILKFIRNSMNCNSVIEG